MFDLRRTLRGLVRSPGFTLAAICSLAIGIGANTAIYSVASALLLRPLPYADAERLVILWNRSPGLGITEDWFSTAQYFDVVAGTTAFEQVAIAVGANYNLSDGRGEPERVGTMRVSSNLLPMLGGHAIAGRLLERQDDSAGAAGVAVLAYGTWQRRYGGSSDVLGKRIELNGLPYQIVGVLPRGFDLPREVLPTLGVVEHAEILINLPLAADAATIRTREDYNILAKLKPGVAIGQAQADLDTLTVRLRRDHPDIYPPNGGLTFSAVPLQEQVVGRVRPSLLILSGAVALVLLIACANVASLALVRGMGRQHEIAVRTSLGAGRRRIVLPLLGESIALALAGGSAGLLVAALALRGIRLLGASSVPRIEAIAIDGTVLVFTIAVSIASGVLFGLIPALGFGRADPRAVLNEGGRRAAGGSLWGRGQHARRALVIAELAIAIVLLVGATLLIRSFARLQNVAPGFTAANTLTLELTMTGRKYAEPEVVVQTYRELCTRLAAVPGVVSAGAVSALPLSQMMAWGPITIEGRALVPGEAFINVDLRMVAGEYFDTMRIPLVTGRIFNQHDTRSTVRVVVVDEHMAAELWPHQDPIGKRVRVGGADSTFPWLTVVGVVGRVKQDALDSEPRMAMYLPHAQSTARAMNVVVRTAGPPDAMTGAVRGVVRALDPDLPMYGVRTMEDRVAASLATRRFSMLLLTLFAIVALGLATVGIYAVLAQVVSQGTREVGIRMALGATPGGVSRLVLRQGAIVCAVGVTAGVGGALVAARWVESLLFGVSARDPVTFVAAPALLAGVALAAAWIPARRAARLDPVICLRSE